MHERTKANIKKRGTNGSEIWPLLWPTHRAVLALHAGAVEAERRDSMADPLDVKDAFIASLARLGLWQVLGLQGYWLHLPNWDEDLLRRDQLGTVLRGTGEGREHRAESAGVSAQHQNKSCECRRKGQRQIWAERGLSQRWEKWNATLSSSYQAKK